ncbi:MAG: S8 family serine peptidase [Promethearchaeota archaeon]
MGFRKKNINLIIVTLLLSGLLSFVSMGDPVNSDVEIDQGIDQNISMYSFDPKIVRANGFNDKNNDKIQDNLNDKLDAMEDREMTKADLPQSANLDDLGDIDNLLNIRICLTKEPDQELIDRFANFGVEITSIRKQLIYAIEAEVPSDIVPFIALDSEVSLIEEQAMSFAHLDTSTVNLGVRYSPYVWNATSPIKGNSSYSIAILDTGIDSNHTDMENMIYFRDFSSEGYPNGLDGVDYGHHGTHVASIAAGTGFADTNPENVSQVFSGTLEDKTGDYNYFWFEVKDNPSDPDTIVTMNWDNSSGGSVIFQVGDETSWITPETSNSSSSISINLGDLTQGWYVLGCAPGTNNARRENFTVTVSSEYAYSVPTESADKPIFQGVAPNSNLVSLKVLDDSGSGTDSWLLDALDWISVNGKNPLYNITVVSMSLGFGGIYEAIDTEVNNLVDEGFVVVVSAGNGGTNGGTNAINSPGSAAKCITVGAVNGAYEITYYSSNGDDTLTYQKPDVVAPGGTAANIGTNSPNNLILAADSNFGEIDTDLDDAVSNDYRGMQGTSMSCPHVAGLAQLAIDAIIQTEGSWSWSQANALRIKQLICMGTWEVNAGETVNDGDGIPQNPPLDRNSSDYVEGFGMTRGDAVIQSITNSTTGETYSESFYLDRRNGEYAKDPKVLLFSFEAEVGKEYNFNLGVPEDGDFDLLIFDEQCEPDTGRPILITSSINAGLNINEHLVFTPLSNGTYYWSVRAVDGNGTCQISFSTTIDDVDPQWDNIIESGDPLQLGAQETITITATDNIILDTVIININSTDYPMISIGDDQFQYSFTPTVVGQISYFITLNDICDNEAITPPNTIDVIDTTAPEWTFIPIDQTIEFGSGFSYDLEASDLSNIDSYWINDTLNFQIDGNGLLSNKTLLGVGIYNLEIRAYDDEGNHVSVSITVTVEDDEPPPDDDSNESGNIPGYPLLFPISIGLVLLYTGLKRKRIT